MLSIKTNTNDECNKNYYCYNEILYAIQFPKRWARTHMMGTGPIECSNCYKYGFWNNVFVCYCIKCANKYNYDRGGGIHKSIHFGEYGTYHPFVTAACNTYLKDVFLDDIGDKYQFDSVKYWGLEHKWNGIETLNTLTEYYRAMPIPIIKPKTDYFASKKL